MERRELLHESECETKRWAIEPSRYIDIKKVDGVIVNER
jgi:hypothetical protein